MDLTQIITVGISAILSVTAVSAFVIKWAGVLSKYVRIAKDALSLADDVIEAMKDGLVAPEEIAKFTGDLEQLKKDVRG